MNLLPSKLALRVAIILLLVLASGTALFLGTLRAQLQDVTAPQMATDLAASITGIRAVLTALPPEKAAGWIAQVNAEGNLRLEPLLEQAEGVPIPQRRLMFRRMESELRQRTGADTRVSLNQLRSPQLQVDFRTGAGFYRLTLPLALGWSALEPLLWLIGAMALAVWAAVLLVLLQVNRPLRRSAESLARSESQLSEIEMPSSAPQEFRIFAERFNTLARRLRAQERERGLILAGVSHDLRAPLTRIRMRAELIDDHSAGQGLVRDVDSMRHIIDQFLDYQKAASVAAVRQLDAAEVAREVVARYRELGKPVELGGEDVLTVRATPAILERILDNLIDNALAYGAPPVEVRIEQAALLVRDHGDGVPPGELERLLQPFERLDESRGTQGHCGLGLPIVDRLVKQIGGRLELENDPGGGLRARVHLGT